MTTAFSVPKVLQSFHATAEPPIARNSSVRKQGIEEHESHSTEAKRGVGRSWPLHLKIEFIVLVKSLASNEFILNYSSNVHQAFVASMYL